MPSTSMVDSGARGRRQRASSTCVTSRNRLPLALTLRLDSSDTRTCLNGIAFTLVAVITAAYQTHVHLSLGLLSRASYIYSLNVDRDVSWCRDAIDICLDELRYGTIVSRQFYAAWCCTACQSQQSRSSSAPRRVEDLLTCTLQLAPTCIYTPPRATYAAPYTSARA